MYMQVFTNGDCTIVRSANDMWIVGKTPFKVNETFTLVAKGVGVYEMIRSNSKLLGLSNELAVVYFTTVPWVFPVNVIHVEYKNRGLKDIEVTITNNCGVLSYTFDPRPSRMPIEACVACVNGVLVELCCVDYHVTRKGDIVLMGYPGPSRAMEYCSLFRGQVKVIEDKAIDDGFTEAYLSESNVTGLRVLLVLQEVPGAHAVSCFARSPDGKNLIYVTNSSTACRNVQWETADYAKLNEERELSCLDKIDLDFHIFDAAVTRTDTLESVIRARFPNVNHHIREDNAVWIEDLAKEVSNVKCGQIFRDYLVFNENRVMNRSRTMPWFLYSVIHLSIFFTRLGSTTKAVMDKICHVLGVQCIRHDRFYQLGEPLDSLDKFVAQRNCVLISEEGVEIEFVRELLELQSSYFGVAVTYQRDGDVPRFRLCASERVIRWALLSIINPNYLRTLKISEIVELLSFLDQYLLYAVTADAMRVIFERVNEFNVGVIFDLYESVPQLRPLIAEYFYNNLYLLAYWKNSAAASVDLIRDVFACAEHENGAEGDAAVRPSLQHFTLEAPKIYILEWYRKAHWSLFRTEDVLEVLLGPECRDVALEQAVLKHLQEHQIIEGEEIVEESLDPSGPPLHLLNSPEPELVTTIRARLEEREQAKARRTRKKSARKSVSEGVSFSAPAAQESPVVEEKGVPHTEPLREIEKDELSGHSDSVDERSEATLTEKDVLALENDIRASLDLKEINEDLLFRRSRKSSSVQPESIAEEDESEKRTSPKTAWKAPQCEASSPIASSVLEVEGTPTSSKKKSAGRFTPKGTKFRDASNLLLDSQPGTHFAPWAGVASSPPSASAPLMSTILQEEVENAKHTKAMPPAKVASPALKVEGGRQQRRRTSGSVSWSETVPSSSPAASPKTPSLAEIMQEEERRQREGTKRVSRPLQFIEDEERAIDELTQLYRENVGDEVVVRVERCASSADMAAQCPVWTNTPHFRA
ncbi:hypothetical protein ANCCAN_07112 [Ancylostoma caninum]|uniref:Uncharacterized protein n=1 Tax=Ancylostoma caninum TaxID=29170 RepID=A0A368GT64_ANCCA|nr:hypothetical protein ANCCAN_07112 [Ancylostoma caninum]